MSTDQAPKSLRQKRVFTVVVRPATVISAILMISAGFVVLFTLGVMLGRGYMPEADIPKLVRIMPQPGENRAPVVINNQGEETITTQATHKNSGVLGQGDLAYPNKLKAARGAPAAASARQREETKSPGQDKAATIPVSTATANTPPVKSTAQNTTENKDNKLYHYVYQAAAYKSQEPCDLFTAKLKKIGLRARTQKNTENGNVWYRVMVDYTSKPDDLDDLRTKLRGHGVDKPLLKSKLPAN